MAGESDQTGTTAADAGDEISEGQVAGVHSALEKEGEFPLNIIRPSATRPITAPTQVDKTNQGEVRAEIKRLNRVVGEAYYKVGELLWHVSNSKMYSGWGYASFDEYTHSEMGYGERKAQQLIRLWKKLHVDLGVQDEQMLGVGWSHAREIVSVATTSNVNEWLTKARELTVKQVQDEVKESKSVKVKERARAAESPASFMGSPIEQSAGGPGSEPARIHAEPREPARERPERVPDAVDPAPPPEEMKRFSIKLYEGQYESVRKAMELAGKKANSEKTCHQLGMVALEYCATNLNLDSDAQLQWYVKLIETQFKVKVLTFATEKQAKVALAAVIEANQGEKRPNKDQRMDPPRGPRQMRDAPPEA